MEDEDEDTPEPDAHLPLESDSLPPLEGSTQLTTDPTEEEEEKEEATPGGKTRKALAKKSK